MLQVRLIRLGDFEDDWNRLDLETFALRHGEAFFLYFGTLDKLNKPTGQRITLSSEPTDTVQEVPFNPQSDFLVFPVGDVAPLKPATIGRSEHSNVFIPDVSVSALHAIVIKSEAGEYYLLDAGSKNGTFVVDTPVPIVGIDRAFRLTAGQRVRFGSVSLSFLRVGELHTLIGHLLK